VRVLHIGEYVSGGVATYLREVINFQEKDQNIKELFLLISKEKSETDFQITKGKVLYYQYRRNLIGIFRGIFNIFKSINKINPDIIHVHSSYAGFMTRVIYFFKKKDVKIIYCPHGWAFIMDTKEYKKRLFSSVERILSIRTDTIINISNYEYKKSIDYGINSSKSIIIYNGINEKSKNSKLKELSLDKNYINLLFVGRYDKSKGLDILLDIFKKYNFEKTRLYLIGSSVLQDQKIIIPPNVFEIGWVNNRDIDSYYKIFDAVIVPSRWEGFGLVAAEAMKNEKAVIASNRGALPEIVDHDITGKIFDIDDEQDLVQTINSLDKERLKVFGKQAKEKFFEKFTSQRMNSQIISQYLKLTRFKR
jgi:glycosyltransferase involved in cell wall biosynthesis